MSSAYQCKTYLPQHISGNFEANINIIKQAFLLVFNGVVLSDWQQSREFSLELVRVQKFSLSS